MATDVERSGLTARTRIRDSALVLFGRDGFAGTSVRDVARESGVSGGLVLHHFGSKEGLREACDQYVVRMISAKAEQESKSSGEVIQSLLREVDTFAPVIDYLARMLVDGFPQAQQLFELLFEETLAIYREGVQNGTMNRGSDEEMSAVLLLTGGLAPLLLRHQLSQLLGADYLSPELLQRLVVPTLELYTNGLYADSSMLEAARSMTPHSDRTETKR
jgi:AcrR family transcriptional regulator